MSITDREPPVWPEAARWMADRPKSRPLVAVIASFWISLGSMESFLSLFSFGGKYGG